MLLKQSPWFSLMFSNQRTKTGGFAFGERGGEGVIAAMLAC